MSKIEDLHWKSLLHQGDVSAENGDLATAKIWYRKAIQYQREHGIKVDQPKYMDMIDDMILTED